MVLLHEGVGGAAVGDLWRLWSWDPLVLVGLLAGLALYTSGLVRSRGRRGRLLPWWRPTLFYAGWLALAASLVSPLDALGDDLFFIHMTQHVVITMVATPLMLLGAPFVPVMRGFPPGFRRGVVIPVVRSAWVRRPLRLVTQPLVALALYVVVLWVWHAPALYGLALRAAPAHALEHLSFAGAAMAFWWVVIDPVPLRSRIGYLPRLPYLVAAAVQNIALGAYITFAATVLYPFYDTADRLWGLTVLEDQQLAGLIMWVPGSMMYLLALFVVFGVMLAREEERTRRREAEEAGLHSHARP